ncbi:MAG: DUF2892 domain-containing protein [Balneolaceae bacterium]|nr:DUF2892 domain-containing protein [Balneolaceae bacterium]
MGLKKNMGTADRLIRLVVAAGVAALIITGTVSGVLAIALGAFAGVFAATSFVSTCPLYMPFGLSSRK